MKFIVDAQLPPALARFLAAKGEDVVHVLDVQMMESSDSQIWDEVKSELSNGAHLVELLG
jgi:predicted nuclease of predicted toxin-antitoxin system